MPKVTARTKILTIKGAPAEATVKVKTSSRARNRSGRVTSSAIKTTHDFLPPDPPSPPSVLPDLYPEDPASEDETENHVLPRTRKGPSRAVSVSFFVDDAWQFELNRHRPN